MSTDEIISRTRLLENDIKVVYVLHGALGVCFLIKAPPPGSLEPMEVGQCLHEQGVKHMHSWHSFSW